MAIKRTVETDVYCDICGEWITGWKSNDTGVSRTWAAVFAREKGCTVGKKVVCRNCRIKKRIQICSIQRKIGSAGRDSNGMCLGFGIAALVLAWIGSRVILSIRRQQKKFEIEDETYNKVKEAIKEKENKNEK